MNLSFALLFLAPAVALADGTAEPAFEPTLLPSTGKGGKGGGSKGLPSEPTIISSASSSVSSGKARRSSSGPSPAPSGGKASASRSSKGSGSADTEVSFPLLLRRDRRHRRRLGSKALKKSKGASESTVSAKSPKSSPAPTTLATVEDTEIAP